jgi:SAM-dependent methyltransferase
MTTRWNDGDFTMGMEKLVWTASPVVRRYLHTLISGNPDCDWPTFLEQRHLPSQVESALVLGSGSGWLERGLAERRRFRSIVAGDFAGEVVEKARATAADRSLASIQYRVLDLEHENLGGPYDAIFAHDVLHHITNLEGLYVRVHDALAPGGRFFFQEYVGPNRFQYSDQRIDIVNRYFRLLPVELRLHPFWNGVLPYKTRVDPDKLAAQDPTEAVRSEDILPLARGFFDVEAEYPYGGGLLNPLLYELIVNFDEDDPYHNGLLRFLCDAEDRLTRASVIEPDFAIFVGSCKTV